jgi:NAD(P)-dependent dehydrogenase (short-subunit alcohol dehydrogenase family)
MARVLIIGGTGRLGSAVGDRLHKRGDQVYLLGRKFDVLPEGINYAIFCQRYRGEESIRGEFEASAVLTNAVLKQLGFADEGDCGVVMVSSVYGVSPGPGVLGNEDARIGYHLGKAAEIMLAQYKAATLGVRVNCVSPWGFTGTDPVLKMEEVVNVIEFLCSDKATGINGQNIVLDKNKRLGWA